MTADGSTSNANDTFVYFTALGINRDWEVVSFVLNCSRSEGSTTGDELTKKMEAMIESHKLNGRVTVGVTDCEPSMVVAGRRLTERKC